MLSKRWITNLQNLLKRDITPDDILLIKLLTIDTYDGKPDIQIKICPARFYHQNSAITWAINDYGSDTLFIETVDTNRDLGLVKIDDNLVHSILGCQILTIPYETMFFKISDSADNELTKTATKTDAVAIQKAASMITNEKLNVIEI